MKIFISTVSFVIVLTSSLITFGDNPPCASIRPWEKSLEIEDISGNKVTLNHARIIDRYVDGKIPDHDSKYDKYRMELIASFDRDIPANSIRMYGQIYSTGNDAIWLIIEAICKEKVRKCWKPIDIPEVKAGQKIELIKTLLNGDDFSIKYNSNNILSEPYSLSFVEWIQTLYCGIYCLDNSSFGATCTIDVVLINDSTDEQITVNTITYFITDGKYEKPTEWFNSRLKWYRQLPEDFSLGYNCSFELIDDSPFIETPGSILIDGVGKLSIGKNKYHLRDGCVRKFVSKVKNEQYLFSYNREEMIRQWNSFGIGSNKTAACALYSENNETNLIGLVKCGDVNSIEKMTPLSTVDYSNEYVDFEIDVIKSNGCTYAVYKVNNVPFLYNGEKEIPVVDYSSDVQSFSMYGTATLFDMYGYLIPLWGLSVIFR